MINYYYIYLFQNIIKNASNIIKNFINKNYYVYLFTNLVFKECIDHIYCIYGIIYILILICIINIILYPWYEFKLTSKQRKTLMKNYELQNEERKKYIENYELQKNKMFNDQNNNCNNCNKSINHYTSYIL